MKKKVLMVCPSFYPAYKSGGPVRSATNLIRLLNNKYEIDVFTADRDLGDNKAFANIHVNSWCNKYFGTNVYYLSESNYSFFKLMNIFKKKYYDVIYLNSFFNYRYTISFLFLYKFGFIKCGSIILAPRGELTRGAMSFRYLKKKLYLFFYNLLGLGINIKYHFTSREEQLESVEFINSSNYILAPNMHSDIPPYRKKSKTVGYLELVFLSRISPKKNLLLVLDTLSKVQDGNVNLIIAGEIDDKLYWEKCKDRILTLPNNITVNFLGALNRESVSELLFNSHTFMLPTLNENYGHAIVEAMMHSNLVLISENTPWSGVQFYNGSVVYNEELDNYVDKIQEMLLLDEELFNVKTKNIYKYCESILENNIEAISNIFE